MVKMSIKRKYFYYVFLLLLIFISSFYGACVNADTVSTEWTPKFKTSLTDETLSDGMFSYRITSKNNGPLPSDTSVTNNGENVVFGAVTFDASHVGNTYYYIISQDKNYYQATPESYEISVKVSRNANNNIIATENILKNTNNPNANKLGAITWEIGGWGVRSTGDGKGSIHTLDDVPTKEKTVFRITDHTTGNKDWGQTIIPYTNGYEYTVSGYVRIPTESSYDTAKALIRLWDSGQGRAIFSKTLTINKSDGWVPYSYKYTFNGTEDNTSYQVGVTGAGDIELNGMRLESSQSSIVRTFVNEYIGTPVTVDVNTKGGFDNESFTFKVKAWKDDENTNDRTYLDLSSKGLTSIGDNYYTFELESNSDDQEEFELPTGFDYEISLVDKDGWFLYSVDGDKNKSSVSGVMKNGNSHLFVVAEDPIDITIKKVDENGDFLSNAVMRITEGVSVDSQWKSEAEAHTASLSDGTYILNEVAAPVGYYKAQKIEFVVKNGKLYIDDEEKTDKTITMTDVAKPRYKFAKIDKETGEFLKDAWMIINQNGMPVASFRSVDGYYELFLDDGTYQYAEKIAPTGYKLSDPVNFSIENGVLKDASGDPVEAITMKDEIALGTLTLSKKNTSGDFLPNAKYRFWGTDFAGNAIEKTLTTDRNGKISVKDLPLGDYHYQEIEAPLGYELDKTVYDISLSSSNSNLEAESSTVTTEKLCKLHNSEEGYYYYDYDNDSYSQTKSDYVDLLGNGSVYIGGNAKSAYSSTSVFDDDPDDFTNILPYGNVYVNTDKIKFDNALLMFPADTPFHLVKKGEKEIDVTGTEVSDNIYTNTITDDGAIVYFGSLTSYIKGVGGYGAYGTDNFGMLSDEGFDILVNNGDKEDGTKAEHYEEHDAATYGNTVVHYKDGQNIISNSEDGYLYQITYQDAVVLPDGSMGDLVYTCNEVIFETGTDIPENTPISIQRANQMFLAPTVYMNNDNKTIKYPSVVYSSLASNKDIYTTGNTRNLNGTYKMMNGLGVSIDFSLKVQTKDGQTVNGTISYSAQDLDLPSNDNLWGRIAGLEYAEGIEIKSGAKSFAVMPKYDHAEDGTTVETGWILDREHILEVNETGGTGNANGIRFYAPGYVKYRNSDGQKIRALDRTNTAQHVTISSKSQFDNPTITNDQYVIQRNDNETFDTGFAVLLDSANSNMRWTGSVGRTQISIGTTLFDSSAFVRLQQSHGTGGDLYIEAYDYTDNCSLSPIRSDVSMGIGSSNTLAMVPDNGWEIEKITINGTTVMFSDLSFNNEGVATYDFNGVTYIFTKDSTNPKKVRVSFDDVRENHSISVDYIPVIEESRTNIKAYGDLIINKKDKDTNEAMSGVVFTLSGKSDLGETINLTKTTDSEGKIKFENVPAGEYKLHEKPLANYQTIPDKNVIIARSKESKEVTLEILNEKLKYDLTIKKKVAGRTADVNREFDYKVTIYEKDKPVSKKLKIEKNGESFEISNGSIIKLKHNEQAVIEDLLANYKYSIIETDTEYDESYKIDTRAGDVVKKTTEGNIIAGQVLNDDHIVTYINHSNSISGNGKISGIVATGISTEAKPYTLIALISIVSLSGLYFTNKKFKFAKEQE